MNTLLLAFSFSLALLTPCHHRPASSTWLERKKKQKEKRAEEKKIRHGSASLVERARAATITASRERITRKTHDAVDDDDDGAKGEWKRQNARVNFLAKKKDKCGWCVMCKGLCETEGERKKFFSHFSPPSSHYPAKASPSIAYSTHQMLREWQKCALVIVVGSRVLPAWYEKLCRVKSNENGGKEKGKKYISGDNDDTSHLLTSAEKSPFVRTQKLFNFYFTFFSFFFSLFRPPSLKIYQHSLSSSTIFFLFLARPSCTLLTAQQSQNWCDVWYEGWIFLSVSFL